jgi:hypothetical protein
VPTKCQWVQHLPAATAKNQGKRIRIVCHEAMDTTADIRKRYCQSCNHWQVAFLAQQVNFRALFFPPSCELVRGKGDGERLTVG